MKSIIFAFLCVLFMTPDAFAQNNIKEPSTGKWFPEWITFKHGGRDYTLGATGTAVRKKLIVKVYGMVHYVENPEKAGSKWDAFNEVIYTNKAKQITMDFVRDVDVPKIRDAYLTGFKENCSKEEFNRIQGQINQFLVYFDRDVKENDRFILRWLPGGSVVAIIANTEKPAITNELFARTLWLIWFGNDSIVDRDDLITRLLK
jgi:hypothetical protein